MSSLRLATGWLRRKLAWSNSRQSWYERLGVLALLALAVGGWWLCRDRGLETRLLLLAGWLLLLALLLRRGLIKLFGPVFFFEILRGSRRRVHLTRVMYGLILLIAVAYVHGMRSAFDHDYSSYDLSAQAEVANTAFLVFFCIQMVVVAFLTPVVVAGCIAEDKERRTLEFVLATDLRSREIVLGKLAGRMANLVLVLLAGLPVLSFLQFLGGIPPDFLLASFVVTGLTLLSVAAISLWHSVMLKRSRDAIVLTFLSIAAYLTLSGAGYLLLELDDFRQAKLTVGTWTITSTDMLDAFGAGNPFVHLSTILSRAARTDNFMDVLPQILQEYAIFHGLFIVVGIGWATARLRPVALFQGAGETKRARKGRRLPALGRFPMVWKELFAEPAMRLPWMLKIPLILVVIATFIAPALIFAEHADALLSQLLTPPKPQYIWTGYPDLRAPEPGAWSSFGEDMNIWVRWMSGAVGTLLLLAIAARAAGSVSGERARKTLDELLTTPLSNGDIIGAKWLGSICSVRFGWLWLGSVFLIGLLTEGLNPLGLVLTISAWLSYACMMASVGVWFSVNSRGTFRATLGTLVTVIFMLVGHWVVTGLTCFLPMSLDSSVRDRDVVEWLSMGQLGLTPPAVLGLAPIHRVKELAEIRDGEWKIVVAAAIGCLFYLSACAGLNRLTVARFARLYNRADLRKPELGPPPEPKSAPVSE